MVDLRSCVYERERERERDHHLCDVFISFLRLEIVCNTGDEPRAPANLSLGLGLLNSPNSYHWLSPRQFWVQHASDKLRTTGMYGAILSV